jgi:UDP-glucose 4-epimerase
VDFVAGDVEDFDLVRRCLEGTAGCIHLAAQTSVPKSLEVPQVTSRTNLLGFVNILEAARHQSVRTVVYASSAAVYGHAQQLPVNESTARVPLSPYGLDKCVNEDYAALFARLSDTRLVGLRYFNAYGPHQDPASPYSGVISRFMERLRTRKAPQIFGDGRQTRDFVYVGDVARANVLALQSAPGGVYNIGTGREVTLLGLLNLLQELTGNGMEPEWLPPRPADILHSCADISAFAGATGFRSETSLRDGLQATLNWLTHTSTG